MRRVISVSLNGNAFQLEDDAHALLEQYLDAAQRALADNPDRDEILLDLEQAIADKSQRFLGPGRTVLQRADVATIVAEMGSVDGGEAGGASTGAPGAGEATSSGAASAGASEGAGTASGASFAGAGAGGSGNAGEASDAGGGAGASTGAGASSGGASGTGPRRLYQISEGALISGLCNGIAAYFDVDVTFVRIGAVALAFVTGGAAVLGYLALMFIVPYATTSEERAAAHGVPFNARALVERAKRQAADLARNPRWRRSQVQFRREWRRERAEWRREQREARREWRDARRGAWFSSFGASAAATAPEAAPPVSRPYAVRVVVGLVTTLLVLLLGVLAIVWVFAVISLVAHGAVFGWTVPFAHNFWVALVVLLLAWVLISTPLKWVVHGLQTQAYGRSHWNAGATGDSLVGLAFLVAAAWYGYENVPEVRAMIDHAWWWVQSTLGLTTTV